MAPARHVRRLPRQGPRTAAPASASGGWRCLRHQRRSTRGPLPSVCPSTHRRHSCLANHAQRPIFCLVGCPRPPPNAATPDGSAVHAAVGSAPLQRARPETARRRVSHLFAVAEPFISNFETVLSSLLLRNPSAKLVGGYFLTFF